MKNHLLFINICESQKTCTVDASENVLVSSMKPTTSAIAMPDKKDKEKKQIEINKQNKVSAKATTELGWLDSNS